MEPHFISSINAYTLMVIFASVLLPSLGQTFVLLIGSIDLSVGELISFSSLTTAYILLYIWPEGGVFMLFWGVGLGAFFGWLNGIIFTRVKMPSFLTTLGVMFVIRGLLWTLTWAEGVVVWSPIVRYLARGNIIPGIPNFVIWSIGFWLICMFIARYTSLGRRVFAVGGGETEARLVGINVDRTKIYAFVICGALAGLTGVLLAGRAGTGSIRLGERFLLESISAAALGGTALTGGVGGPFGTIAGAVLVTLLTNGMNVVGITNFVQDVIKGIFLVAVIALTLDRSKIPIVK